MWRVNWIFPGSLGGEADFNHGKKGWDFKMLCEEKIEKQNCLVWKLITPLKQVTFNFCISSINLKASFWFLKMIYTCKTFYGKINPSRELRMISHCFLLVTLKNICLMKLFFPKHISGFFVIYIANVSILIKKVLIESSGFIKVYWFSCKLTSFDDKLPTKASFKFQLIVLILCLDITSFLSDLPFLLF